MIKKILLLSSFAFAYFITNAQEHDDYLGAGHDLEITVETSDPSSNGYLTVDGTGLQNDLQQISRFLTHATLGPTSEEIQYVSQIGMEAWIDQQQEIPRSEYTLTLIEIVEFLYEKCQQSLGSQCDETFMLNEFVWRYAFWHNMMNNEDKLRQRVAMALSELLVISDRSGLRLFPESLTGYYDILSRNAFGNYKDILTEVTLSPAMGFYLSHMNNPKTIEMLNIRPDENYAREIMQLFTIGLYELNQDGSRKVDMSTGLWIPTYDNDDIKGLAKVFTGLSGSKWRDESIPFEVQFGRQFAAYNLVEPMKMYEEWHELGTKTIVGDYTIPAGLTGLEDINLALEHLFNHENVAPFISSHLIQRLVKSNPSPQYIERIAQVFDDNGSGERGDLGAVVKAILLDEEALDCYWIDHPYNGSLRSPMLRYTNLMLSLKAETESEYFFNSAGFYHTFTDQHTLSSPTVFNFYSPDYVPNSEFAYDGLVGPEFEILNSSTSSNYVNYMLLALMGDYINNTYNLNFPNFLNEHQSIPFIDNLNPYKAHLTDERFISLTESPEQLADYLDLLLANGNLSAGTKSRIVNALNSGIFQRPIDKARYAAFLVLIDPDYVIQK